MAEKDLASLLSGEALGISKERLDMQGWDAAFQTYQGATTEERRLMELHLAKTIASTDNWSLIADAILLARSVKMGDPLMRDSINSVEIKAPPDWVEVISTEAERYRRDVPEPAQLA